MFTIPGVHFAITDLITWLIVGALAGYFASVLMRGRGYGCLGNIIVGLIGAVIGGYLVSVLDITGTFHFCGSLAISFVGACVLLFILQALGGNRRRSR